MNSVKLEVLSAEEVRDICDAAIAILGEIGVEIFEQQAMEILVQVGATVEEGRVRLPEKLVLDNLDRVPAKFSLHARNPKNTVTVGGGSPLIEPMIGRINVIDLDSGEKRRTSIEDVARLIKLADAMKNYHVLHSGAVMPRIEGVPEGMAHVHGYIQSVSNSSKLVKGSGRGRQVAEDCITMASIVMGKRIEELAPEPPLFTTINVISPLRHDRAQTEGLLTYARYGIPVEITSEPQMGATSPVTFAGTLIQQTAEVISGIVLAQAVNPGTPVIFGTCAAAMDLRNGLIALGGVEGSMINVAHAQIARHLGIPSRGTGSNTDSKVLDVQAGYEKALTLVMTVLAGNDIIFYPGTIEHALTIDYRSLLIDNEICGMALRAARGIDVNEQTQAVELIKETALKGNYLGKKHTVMNMSKELFFVELTDRDTREDWMEKGGRALDAIATERVKEILQTHKPDPLPQNVYQDLLAFQRDVEHRQSAARSK
ncbi:MAG: trimethylamine methyltransferase family protein [Spirochaetaceae bacterium]|nr:MAG: trimethylamine methyltransferase family protein [Spirochaetaceae bacterium]